VLWIPLAENRRKPGIFNQRDYGRLRQLIEVLNGL
jgi:hypothetical protein